MKGMAPATSVKDAVPTVWLLLLLSAIFANSQELRTIDGQMFIRTNSAETIKLSLVQVMLYDEKTIADDLEKKRNAASPIDEYLGPLKKTTEEAYKAEEAKDKGSEAWLKAFKMFEDIRGKADYTHSAKYYCSKLPNPLQTAKTDADGKFIFNVKPGSYALVAETARIVGVRIVSEVPFPNTESYHWMVRVNADTDTKVMLANDNLSTSGSKDSLVFTPDAEAYIESTLDIETLSAFVEEDRRKHAAENTHKEPAPEVNLFKNPEEAQAKAVQLFPNLAVAGSALNREFIKRIKDYKTNKKEFFIVPDWPIRLATESNEAITAGQPKEEGSFVVSDFLSRPAMPVPYNLRQRLAGARTSASASISYSGGTITNVLITKSSGNSSLDAAIIRHVKGNFRVKAGVSGSATLPVNIVN